MTIPTSYKADADIILSHRYDNGGDYWATEDLKLIKGSPFNTLECVLYLLELGMEPEDTILTGAAEMIFRTWRPDGRFKVYPKGGIYPCHTTSAASVLCHLGYAKDARIQKTLQHLLEIQYQDGGWRCQKFSYGHGPETEYSNPYPTVMALDAFRYSDYLNKEAALDKAVAFLLDHWTIKKPIGPCHYGIGSLFKQVEYPFRGYNIFEYVYVLSYYDSAKKDKRFLEAFDMLESKTVNGKIIVERVVPKLAKLSFCQKGEASELATKRYQEILANIHAK